MAIIESIPMQRQEQSAVHARSGRAHGHGGMSAGCRHEDGADARRASQDWARLKQMAA